MHRKRVRVPHETRAAPSAPPDHHEDEHVDVTELEDAHDVSTSGVDRVVQAFPGAQLIVEETS